MVSPIQFLLQVQASDGGWGYQAGGMSFVEPTAAAILALSSDNKTSDNTASAIRAAETFLLTLQHADGGWGIAGIDTESGWMTAWAVLALANSKDAEQTGEKGVDWLLAHEGLRATDAQSIKQIRELFHMDGSLRGWSWVPGDFAWVHPTAVAVRALCVAGRSREPRAVEGVDFLLDRAAPTGGWNLGNPEMFSNQMPPSVIDTATVLIALAAAGLTADQLQVQRGLGWLRNAVETSKSPAQLAWGICGLKHWGIEANAALLRLRRLQDQSGGWINNPLVTAFSVMAGAG